MNVRQLAISLVMQFIATFIFGGAAIIAVREATVPTLHGLAMTTVMFVLVAMTLLGYAWTIVAYVAADPSRRQSLSLLIESSNWLECGLGCFAISLLVGNRFGFGRGRSAQLWREWWRDNKTSLVWDPVIGRLIERRGDRAEERKIAQDCARLQSVGSGTVT